jgi:hypothetical protein
MLGREELRVAERVLRLYDKALRLRFSEIEPHIVLIERKTFRGRIGKLFRGEPFSPDQGRRAEQGHVHVASLPAAVFETAALRDALIAADSWKRGIPAWQAAEAADDAEKTRRILRRKDMLRYKASELFDRFAWRYGMRVRVPEQVS